MNVKQIRYLNARRLVEQIGGISAFAEKIGRSQAQASNTFGSNPVRNIGDNLAAEIEQTFGLAPGALHPFIVGLFALVDRCSFLFWGFLAGGNFCVFGLILGDRGMTNSCITGSMVAP